MAEYSLAQRLRVARAYRGLSQTALAKRTGLHNVQISKLERGITKEIVGSTLRALCEALDVSPQYLLGMTDAIEHNGGNAKSAAQRPRPRKAAPVR